MTGSFTDRFGGITVYPSEIGYAAYTMTQNMTLVWPELGDTSSNLAVSFIRASSTVTGSAFILPDATETTPGRALRFKNIGSIAIPVEKSDASALITVSAGQDFLVSLIDNTTTTGIWDTTQLGTGTSSADAAFLAGKGLFTSGHTLNVGFPVVTYSSTPQFMTSSQQATVLKWTGGAGIFNLTAGTDGLNFFTLIKNQGTGVLTIEAFPSTIDGQENIQLNPNDSTIITAEDDNNDYSTIGLTNYLAAIFNAIQIDSPSDPTIITAGQSTNRTFVITGNLLSTGPTTNLIFPNIQNAYIISNRIDDSFNNGVQLVVSVSGSSSGLTIPYGMTRFIYSDGSNFFFADDLTSVRAAQNLLWYTDFSVNPWQRGISFTSSSVYQYTADRVTMLSKSGADHVLTQSASTYTGSQYDLVFQRISGSTNTGSGLLGFDLQTNESIPMRGNRITFAAAVKMGNTTAGSFFDFLLVTGTGTDQRVIGTYSGETILEEAGFDTQTFPPYTSDYRLLTMSGVVPTSATQVGVRMVHQPSGTADNKDYVAIAKMAIVNGTFNSFDSMDTNLMRNRCEAFCYVPTASALGQGFYAGQCVSANQAVFPVQFPVTMRSGAPVLTVTAANWQITTSTGAASTVSAITFSGPNRQGGELVVTTISSLLTAGNVTRLQASTSVANLIFSNDL